MRLGSSGEFQQYQIVQETIDFYRVRFVSDHELSRDGEFKLVKEIRIVLGYPAEIEFVRVDSIARTSRGKYLTAISKVS